MSQTENKKGFKGTGRMNVDTAKDWIHTFFFGGADVIIDYYADDFVFEDLTYFQTIDNKEDLHRAFVQFSNPQAAEGTSGTHDFDIIRYDGGLAGDHRAVMQPKPDRWTQEEWDQWTAEASLGGHRNDYDEWANITWIWRATHTDDEFCGLTGMKGKTTYVRGQTFHLYKNRQIVREYTQWNFREVAVQVGAYPMPEKFWLAK
uniref:Alpha pinene oxide lyase n=1 Tax=Pseudomonas rhodesiae TaxID=76760 RepID=A0A0U2U334_9PSED|nr:alpha pinene oxide lyase [Pseudomonas rhodesiae]AUL81538.1 alpha-pinene oxide lyase [Pseudomonas rhodesiae]